MIIRKELCSQLLAAMIVIVLVLSSAPLQATAAVDSIVAEVQPLYVVVDDPTLHYTPLGTGYDGVGEVIVDTGSGYIGGSGVLLSTGRHILTAAHMVDSAVWANVWFDLPTGSESRSASAFFVYPDWDPLNLNNDIAIIELAVEAPIAVDRYDIYRNSVEVGEVGFKTGYGATGTGDTGWVGWPPVGVKVGGNNLYDALGDIFDVVSGLDPLPGTQLAYDFDNGLVANDAFDYFFGIADLGLGMDEVSAAPGDSGGPTFIDGAIAGITSYGVRLSYVGGETSDIDSGLNSSFGEFVVDTRVSAYSGWVDSIIIPEPSTIILLGSGLLGLVGYLRKNLHCKKRGSG